MFALNLALCVLIPLLLGLAVSCYLQSASLKLLTDLCLTQLRADFWVKVLNVLYLGVPILLSLFFAPNLLTAEPAYVAQRSLMLAILGMVSAILIVAYRIMSGVNAQNKAVATLTSPPASKANWLS